LPGEKRRPQAKKRGQPGSMTRNETPGQGMKEPDGEQSKYAFHKVEDHLVLAEQGRSDGQKVEEEMRLVNRVDRLSSAHPAYLRGHGMHGVATESAGDLPISGVVDVNGLRQVEGGGGRCQQQHDRPVRPFPGRWLAGELRPL